MRSVAGNMIDDGPKREKRIEFLLCVGTSRGRSAGVGRWHEEYALCQGLPTFR